MKRYENRRRAMNKMKTKSKGDAQLNACTTTTILRIPEDNVSEIYYWVKCYDG